MSVRMPEVDGAVLARRERIVAALRTIVPGEGVIAGEREMKPYEPDGLTAYHQPPMVVVLPETTEQVAQVLRYCHDEGIKAVSYTHLRAHETRHDLVCRLLLEKKKK